MRRFGLLSLLLSASANAHTIFQRVSVNGADQGFLTGVRSPDSDYPVTNVQDSSLACNTGLHSPVSQTVISIPAGAKVGALWGHVLGGAQFSGDPDNPIASSHKGPVIVYLAKVSDAATAGTSGLSWFKIAQDGLDSSGKWGVDRMISNGGWSYFTLPTCIAPGDYLLRVEIVALHTAYSQGGAQFYMSCANIRVTGSGTDTGSNFVSLPGAYSASDPGILLNIYDDNGQPTNGGKAYTPPGGPVHSCGSSGGGDPGNGGGDGGSGGGDDGGNGGGDNGGGGSGTGSPLYGQCGGIGYSGPTTCAQGTCKVSNDYYSQCLP